MTAHLSINAFDGTTRLKDPYHILEEYTSLVYTTGYPAGLFLNCRFRLPLVGFRKLPIQHGHRIIVRDGPKTVWEGVVVELIYHDRIDVNCIGYWGSLLMRRNWEKHWADQRITEEAWTLDESAGGAGPELVFVDRNNRIRFTPKNEAWGNGEFAQVLYTAPTDTTIDRIEYDYDFDEQAQDWRLRIHDLTAGTSVVSINTTGTGVSQSHDFSPVSSQISLQLRSGGGQTPTSNGDYYGEFANLTVYATFEGSTAGTEGTLNIAELCYDTIDKLGGELSASTALIDSGLTNSVIPFISKEAEPIADMLIRAASYGDTSNDPVAVGLRESDIVSDSLPVLFAEQYPTLDDFEYRLSWLDENRSGGSMAQSTLDVANYIWVEYTTERGFRAIVSPADNAALTNSTSVSNNPWGQIDRSVSLDAETTEEQAVKWGARYLSRFQNLQWTVKTPVRVTDYLQSKFKRRIPAAQVRAGQRVKLVDFAEEDQIFIITHTSYNDERRQLTFSAGIPPFLFDGRLIK